MKSSATPARSELFGLIANAAISGYLGLFVGSGFSRAATGGKAPTFVDLVRQLNDRLGIGADIDNDAAYRFRSLPQVASQLLKTLAGSCGAARAESLLREEVAHLCNFHPTDPPRTQLAVAINSITPSWVITTNYDLVLESILERAVSVLPNQPMIARPDRVPIYHLHGHRLSPQSIRITEEDYVSLLGPIDYPRLKLPALFAESTTVMLGYALGDINVRAAMDWAHSFSSKSGLEPTAGQGEVVLALYQPSAPAQEPFRGPDGEVVLEIAGVVEFLEELRTYTDAARKRLADIESALSTFLADPQSAINAGTPGQDRNNLLVIVSKALPYAHATRLVEFLSQALEPIWTKAREDGGWEYYNQYVTLLIDVLARIDISQCNPTLLAFLADALDRVGWYLGSGTGSAWSATSTWIQRSSEISDAVKRELLSYAVAADRFSLRKLVEMSDTSLVAAAD